MTVAALERCSSAAWFNSAESIPLSARNFALPETTRFPSTVPTTPLPTGESKSVIADLRNTTVLGSINGVKAATSSINETGVTHFLGTRYDFNVLKNTAPSYNDAMRAYGVDNAGNGWLCNNSASKIITTYGFVALKKLAAGGGVTTLSYCRKNPAAL